MTSNANNEENTARNSDTTDTTRSGRSPRGGRRSPRHSPRGPFDGAFWSAGQRRMIDHTEGERLAMKGEVAKISPGENVYSYLLFILPLEHEKHKGKTTWKSILSVCLVLLALLIKGILLYAIFRAVVFEDEKWRNSILKPEASTFAAAPKCNDGKSLCEFVNGTYSCAPPTIQLLGRWDELDVNGDGVWTREEAVEMQEPLKCKFVVDPVEVFDVFINFLKSRSKVIWMSPDITEGKAIHKAYFTFASGDLIMCGYRTPKMCPNLLERGFFDGPLKDGTSPRVGKTIDSALQYCHGLLEEGGTCERFLPSTYSAWKYLSEGQCWESDYDKIVYKHPKTGQQKSLLAVDYDAPSAYARGASDPLFRIFKGIIIGLFLVSMYAELKDVLLVFHFVAKYPSEKEVPEGEHVTKTVDDETGEIIFKILCITQAHRTAIGVVAVLRALMVCVLIWVGVSFLIRDTDWVNLVLNGVALVFIVEVGEILFTKVVDSHVQEEFSNMEPMYVELGGNRWLNHNIALRDIVGFLVLVVVLTIILGTYLADTAVPISTAVECACLSSGSQCREAKRFDAQFWDNYWLKDIPAVFTTVDQLKVAEDKGKPLLVQPAPAPAPAQAGTVSLSAEVLELEDAMAKNTMAKNALKHQVPSSMKVIHHHESPKNARQLNHGHKAAPQAASVEKDTSTQALRGLVSGQTHLFSGSSLPGQPALYGKYTDP